MPRTPKTDSEFIAFLHDLMLRRGRLKAQIAKDLGVSHPTVYRWLEGHDVPLPASCAKIAEYSGVPLARVLAMAGICPRCGSRRRISSRSFESTRRPSTRTSSMKTWWWDSKNSSCAAGSGGGNNMAEQTGPTVREVYAEAAPAAARVATWV